MTIPIMYSDLFLPGTPKMVTEGLKLYGTKEFIGPNNNPVILKWAEELNIGAYKSDETAWCGLFMGICALRAQKDLTPIGKPADMLWARHWARFGQKVDWPMLGDVIVFERDKGGHVALYVGEDETSFHILGGNQGNEVSIIRHVKSKALAFRRPFYNVQPMGVRRIMRNKNGKFFDGRG